MGCGHGYGHGVGPRLYHVPNVATPPYGMTLLVPSSPTVLVPLCGMTSISKSAHPSPYPGCSLHPLISRVMVLAHTAGRLTDA